MKEDRRKLEVSLTFVDPYEGEVNHDLQRIQRKLVWSIKNQLNQNEIKFSQRALLQKCHRLTVRNAFQRIRNALDKRCVLLSSVTGITMLGLLGIESMVYY
uniref:Uncharacterized protein n=1 Tax=Anopheles atroparvus TaxID=41427 RepID=A0AAG5D0F7_ANOAO